LLAALTYFFLKRATDIARYHQLTSTNFIARDDDDDDGDDDDIKW